MNMIFLKIIFFMNVKIVYPFVKNKMLIVIKQDLIENINNLYSVCQAITSIKLTIVVKVVERDVINVNKI